MKTTQIQIPIDPIIKVVDVDREYLFETEYRPVGDWRESSVDPVDLVDMFVNPYVEITIIRAYFEELIIVKIPITGANYVIYAINRYVVDNTLRINVWKLEL